MPKRVTSVVMQDSTRAKIAELSEIGGNMSTVIQRAVNALYFLYKEVKAGRTIASYEVNEAGEKVNFKELVIIP